MHCVGSQGLTCWEASSFLVLVLVVFHQCRPEVWNSHLFSMWRQITATEFCFPWNAQVVPLYGQLTFNFHTNYKHLNPFRSFNFCFLLLVFVIMQRFPVNSRCTSYWVSEATYCVLFVALNYFWAPSPIAEATETLPRFTDKKLLCSRDRNWSVWKSFYPSLCGGFLGRHLEARAPFQRLPVTRHCLGILVAFIYPAALYLGPSSLSLSINCKIRERTGSKWLV